MLKSIPLAALAVSLLAATATPGWAAPDKLFSAINERLSYMQSVAAWKADNDKPVEDLPREKVVLEAARAKAVENGLSADNVTLFFQAQIDAAKDIQTCWIDRWNGGEARPKNVPDLIKDVRPELLRLGNDILTLLAETPVEASDKAAFTQAVTVECLSDGARTALFEGLVDVHE
ncbi:gamma subclass chorismate mutase AroQ [Roseibium sp. FZY0029]|uniref:gamma subclass chorismate mutase AroQ n=1 Tax=Roseibium sp. FZY0029 TaxID=3116647 RepID=UPI002EA4BCB2|nr:gamma subclass chorismate mutase AroQ [Roseibium sp. FZY0029]